MNWILHLGTVLSISFQFVVNWKVKFAFRTQFSNEKTISSTTKQLYTHTTEGQELNTIFICFIFLVTIDGDGPHMGDRPHIGNGPHMGDGLHLGDPKAPADPQADEDVIQP